MRILHTDVATVGVGDKAYLTGAYDKFSDIKPALGGGFVCGTV